MFFSIALLGCLGLSAQTKSIDSTVKPVDTPKVYKSTFDNSKEQLVEITTNFGVMVAKLYNSTPQHRDNFIA